MVVAAPGSLSCRVHPPTYGVTRPKLQSPVYPPRVYCYAMPRLKVVSLCRITDHGLPTVFGLKRLLYVGPSEGLALAPRSYRLGFWVLGFRHLSPVLNKDLNRHGLNAKEPSAPGPRNFQSTEPLA